MIRRNRQISDKDLGYVAGGQIAEETHIVNKNGQITGTKSYKVLSDTANEDGSFNILGEASSREEAQRLAREKGVSDKITYRESSYYKPLNPNTSNE